MRPSVPLLLVIALMATVLTACGGGMSDDPDTVNVVYKRNTNNKVRHLDDYLSQVRDDFERTHPGKKVKLVPIQASDPDYYVKVSQMMRSTKTAPDVLYEDSFQINSDIESGYLRPLDRYLDSWPEWEQFVDTARDAATAEDGRTYGVPSGTDTRGLWFDKRVFAKAGLPADWQPKTWDDILRAARVIKKKVPGAIPLNIYTGKGPGEAAVMQGFEMLLYGTGDDPLYDSKSHKWVTGGRGFSDALDFVRTVYAEKLGPDPSDAVDPNIGTRVKTQWMPQGKLGINLDGSWLGQEWLSSGSTPWPKWSSVLGQAAMPTQHGQPPGKVSMSGGWTWALPAQSTKADLAWEFVETLQTKENAVKWDVSDAGIAVRDDVAKDPTYRSAMPGVEFFTSLVEDTHYRPALPVYPQVSAAIGEAMESVTTGSATARKAARKYDSTLRSITDGATVQRP